MKIGFEPAKKERLSTEYIFRRLGVGGYYPSSGPGVNELQQAWAKRRVNTESTIDDLLGDAVLGHGEAP